MTYQRRLGRSADTWSAIASLKEIVTIVSGLAAGNAVVRLMESAKLHGRYSLGEVKLPSLLLFGTLIVTIVRFYHGNIRHLDTTYSGTSGKGHAGAFGFGARSQLAWDFVVILAESLIVTVASFLIDNPPEFALSMSSLLLVDAFWFFFLHTPDATEESRSRWWAFNNIVFGLVMLGLGLRARAPEAVWAVSIGAVGLANTVLDVGNEFAFYFPSRARRNLIVFVSAPLTVKLDSRPLRVSEAFKTELELLFRPIEEAGFVVYSAHRREAWGRSLFSPSEALVADLRQIEDSDLVVALIEDPPSPGVQIEVGHALSCGKPIVQVYRPGTELPYLNRGLAAVVPSTDVVIGRDGRWRDDLVAAIARLTED